MAGHPEAVYQWTQEVTTHLPHLSKPQATVLALWSLGMVLARSCSLTAVTKRKSTSLLGGSKSPLDSEP